ncbi:MULTISPECIES: nicotinamide mononucleotide transporter [Humibacter]|jgi:hypothetical protein
MFAVLDWLTAPLAMPGSQVVTVEALLGAVALLAGLVAVARFADRAWPVAAAVCGAFALLALLEVRFVDAGMRLVLAVLCAYGWRARRSGHVRRPRSVSGREAAYGVVLSAIATVVVAYALSGSQASVEQVPANGTSGQSGAVAWGTAIVVVAMYVQVAALARGVVAGWWAGLASAVLSVALSAAAGSWATVAVSMAAAVVCVYGWVCWRRYAASEVVHERVRDEVDEDIVA